MARLKTASEMRQVIKMNEYSQDSPVARRLMDIIERATRDGETNVSGWYSRVEARAIDLTFTPLGYVITYKSFDKEEDSYWISVAW